MENLNDYQNENLSLDATSISLLEKAANWAKFIAVMMFICVGFMVLGVLAIIGAGTMMNGVPTGVFAVVYLVLAGVYLAFGIFLNKFSKKTKDAIITKNNHTLNEGLEGLKNFFTMQGVLMIVAILFGFLAGVMGACAAI